VCVRACVRVRVCVCAVRVHVFMRAVTIMCSRI